MVVVSQRVVMSTVTRSEITLGSSLIADPPVWGLDVSHA